MFLLNNFRLVLDIDLTRFTIQNVSIKSDAEKIYEKIYYNLQYKMFLLNKC